MCRFLLASSSEPLDSVSLLNRFADMAEKSRTVEGDRQGDGWGVAYQEDQKWEVYKSLKPIWEDRKAFATIPSGNVLAAHARSASFPDQVGIVEYNQPYVTKKICFVFNGVLKGVKLGLPLAGKIGAQKIFSLVQEKTLQEVDDLLRNNAKEVIGLNIGIITEKGIQALCDYEEHAEYFGVHWSKNDTIDLVCSEPLEGYAWTKMKKGELYANI